MPHRIPDMLLYRIRCRKKHDMGIKTFFKYLVTIYLQLLIFGVRTDNFAGEPIRYTADFSRLPVGTDVSAMGDAGVVLSRHVTGNIWNPAAASFLKRYEFSIEGADLYQHLSQHGCFAGTAPLPDNYGVSICYLPFYSGRIQMYDTIPEATMLSGIQSHQPTGFIRNYQHLGVLSFARKFPMLLPRTSVTDLPLPLDLSIGCNMKVYAQTMSPYGILYIGMGYNADIGFQARIGLDSDIKTNEVLREIWLGATIRDVLPSDFIWVCSRKNRLISSPEDYREPFNYAQYYGIAYVDRSGDLFAHWTVALAIQKEYALTYHGGVEAGFWNTVYFRGGFSGRTPTCGAGLHYKNFFIDYALRFEEIAFSFIRLSIGIILQPRRDS